MSAEREAQTRHAWRLLSAEHPQRLINTLTIFEVKKIHNANVTCFFIKIIKLTVYVHGSGNRVKSKQKEQLRSHLQFHHMHVIARLSSMQFFMPYFLSIC